MKNYIKFLLGHETAQGLNFRLKLFLSIYNSFVLNLKLKPLHLLDIGCGKNPVIFQYKNKNDHYTGCDFYKNINTKIDKYFQIDLMTDSLVKKVRGKKFDVIFCGEVIEHIFSPDDLLSEIRQLMHKDSILILSTPNLGYYVNRLLLLFGISPLYLENSSRYKLGRKFKFLGQGNATEGHIKVFTYGALLDLIKISKFRIVKIVSCPGPWNFFLDKFVSLFSKSLSATNIFVLKRDD